MHNRRGTGLGTGRARRCGEVSTVVIVGANVAGGRAAETLRRQGFDGRIVRLGAEPEHPYERPPLSKEYLLGTVAEEKFCLRPPAYYDEQGIELFVAALAAHRCKDVAAARQLIARRAPVEPRRLADESTDLRALAK